MALHKNDVGDDERLYTTAGGDQVCWT